MHPQHKAGPAGQAGRHQHRVDQPDGAREVIAPDKVPDGHGKGDAGGQDHQRADGRMVDAGGQHPAGQDAHQGDEGRAGQFEKEGGQAPAHPQVNADDAARQGGCCCLARPPAEHQGKGRRPHRPAEDLGRRPGKGDAPGRRQFQFGLVQAHPAFGQLAGELVHRRHPAQMDGADGDVAHLADLGGARRREDAVGQHIDVELPQVEAAGHDLHGLFDPEHLGPVFQQGLPCRHDKVHDPAALFAVRVQLDISHRFCPLSLAWSAGVRPVPVRRAGGAGAF